MRDEGGYRCGLYASSIRYDGEQLERMQAFLREHILPFVDEHYWLPLYSMGSLAIQREEQLGFRPLTATRAGWTPCAIPCPAGPPLRKGI